MTLTQFRQNKSNMREAMKLRAMPIMQTMLDTWHNEHVMFSASAAGLAPDDKTLRLGQVEGWNMAYQKFMLFFEEPQEPLKPLKATFDAPQ